MTHYYIHRPDFIIRILKLNKQRIFIIDTLQYRNWRWHKTHHRDYCKWNKKVNPLSVRYRKEYILCPNAIMCILDRWYLYQYASEDLITESCGGGRAVLHTTIWVKLSEESRLTLYMVTIDAIQQSKDRGMWSSQLSNGEIEWRRRAHT